MTIDLITIGELCRLTGRRPKAIARAVQDGDLPDPAATIGRAFVWPRASMPALLAGLRRRAARATDPAMSAELADRLAAVA